MLILAFESTAKAASAALLKDGKLLSQYTQCSGLTHSRTLLPMGEDMLKNAELSLKDVDLLAVAHGPGSFTGVRIGVSMVKGLAWASDKPCVGVSTLEAMAWHGLAAGGLICPVMDARRNQVYNALFRIENGRPVRLTEDRPDCVLAPENLRMQDAWGVAMAAQDKEPGNADTLLPVYLRLSQAERERQERLAREESGK